MWEGFTGPVDAHWIGAQTQFHRSSHILGSMASRPDTPASDAGGAGGSKRELAGPADVKTSDVPSDLLEFTTVTARQLVRQLQKGPWRAATRGEEEEGPRGAEKNMSLRRFGRIPSPATRAGRGPRGSAADEVVSLTDRDCDCSPFRASPDGRRRRGEEPVGGGGKIVFGTEREGGGHVARVGGPQLRVVRHPRGSNVR